MNETLRRLLAETGRLTRSARLEEATAVIQRTLGQVFGQSPLATPPTPAAASHTGADVIDVEARVVDREAADSTADSPAATPAAAPSDTPAASAAGRFIAGQFANAAGARRYKLFIPPQAGAAGPRPLLVMLHGCTQNPDDFAAGTRMNRLAEEAGWFVLYPAQSKSANNSGCWNWFREQDQHGGRGEPSILADMTRQVMREHGIDAQRVYVAGLSAGGAMAATLAATCPELYAAVGVHSGLPHGAAHDVASAFVAMSQPKLQPAARGPSTRRSTLPLIVFHGDADNTVHACNGDAVVAGARDPGAVGQPDRVERGNTAGGRSYTRSRYDRADGPGMIEHWLVHGGGHAWFGGSSDGSYTDPNGPDASREMLRFFSEHPKRG